MVTKSMVVCPACSGNQFLPLFEKDGHQYEICRKCDLIRLNPQPDDVELENIYNNSKSSYYQMWGHGEAVYYEMKRRTFHKLLSFLPSDAKCAMSLLDIGAATGILMEVAMEKGFDAYGIEASRNGAASIINKFGSDKVYTGYFDENFEHWNHLKFDVICMSDLFEHLRRPGMILKRIHKFLKDEGCLIIYTPDTSSCSRKIFGKHWPHYSLQHLYLFSRTNMNLLLKNNGFEISEINSGLKYLNMEYSRNVLSSLGHRYIAKPLNLAVNILPKFITRLNVPCYTGQMTLMARKNNYIKGENAC
jgi:2-polyprenyl-3-methyl-5-hydroxy-6-metoxy-1,4-benzoquinol methylase